MQHLALVEGDGHGLGNAHTSAGVSYMSIAMSDTGAAPVGGWCSGYPSE